MDIDEATIRYGFSELEHLARLNIESRSPESSVTRMTSVALFVWDD